MLAIGGSQEPEFASVLHVQLVVGVDVHADAFYSELIGNLHFRSVTQKKNTRKE